MQVIAIAISVDVKDGAQARASRPSAPGSHGGYGGAV